MQKHSFFLILVVCFILPNLLISQNFLQNGGFESGENGWNGLWLRVDNTGMSELVDHPVHSGNKALHIKCWGEQNQDWSYSSETLLLVDPQFVYEFSAWVKADQMKDYAALCITTLDRNQNVTDWLFAIKNTERTNGNYEKFSLKFKVTSEIKYVRPRFVGWDSCDIFIDDASFVIADTVGIGDVYVLENSHLKAEIHSDDFRLNIFDKKSNRQYASSGLATFLPLRVDSIKDGLSFHGIYLPEDLELSVDLSLQDNTLIFQLSADSLSDLNEEIFFPAPILSNAGDFFIVPRASGIIFPVTHHYPFWDFRFWGYKSTMAFVGVTNLASGYMIATDDPWDTGVEFVKNEIQNYYNLQLYHAPSKGKFAYPRKFYLTFVHDNGYVEMCQWYRRHVQQLRPVKTFSEKISENPDVEKLKGAVDFWALEWQFRTEMFLDSLKNYGVDRAIISLGGGWYQPESFAELIDSINVRGLLSSRYDIYTDVWPPTHPEYPWYRTEGYPEDVVVDADGSLHEGWLAYLRDGSPFQGYYTCSSTHLKYAEQWIPPELSTEHYNCRFIDVETASTLMECYSPIHPATRHDDAVNRTQLLDKIKNDFHLVLGSEEARDFTFSDVDFGEGTMTITPAENAGYDWATPTDSPGDYFINYNMNPAMRIPLHQLVFHDVHVATWYTGDGVSKVPNFWDEKDLFNILYASMPLFMPPSLTYWQQNREKFLTSYHLVSAIFRSAGFAKMTHHEMLSSDWKVQKTAFDNGWQVIANFGDDDFSYNETDIPPKGFYATNGSEEVCKKIIQGKTVSCVRLKNRFFLNPYGEEIALDGVRTSGAIWLGKNEHSLDLAFIGDQNFVDINPSLLPWDGVGSFQIFDKTDFRQIPTTDLSDGWVRIPKWNTDRFYVIQFLPTDVSKNGGAEIAEDYGLEIHPNPANSVVAINFSLKKSSQLSVEIYNLLGQRVLTLADGQFEGGHHQIFWNGKDSNANIVDSGIYFIYLKTPFYSKVKKIALVK